MSTDITRAYHKSGMVPMQFLCYLIETRGDKIPDYSLDELWFEIWRDGGPWHFQYDENTNTWLND